MISAAAVPCHGPPAPNTQAEAKPRSFGATGRLPVCPHARVRLFFWPMRASSRNSGGPSWLGRTFSHNQLEKVAHRHEGLISLGCAPHFALNHLNKIQMCRLVELALVPEPK